jgi:hypothetical protein
MHDLSPTNLTRSLGTLRKAGKTKPRSPDLIGTIKIEDHTLKTLVDHYKESGSVTASLAGWIYADDQGKRITVELSPKYVKRKAAQDIDFDHFLE